MEAATMRRTPSAGRRSHRTMSSTTAGSLDDASSLSSSFSGSTLKRGAHGARASSVGDYSAIRAAAGISRMKHGRSRQRGSVLSSENGAIVTEVTSARGRRASVYSLSGLAEVGVKVRRRKKSTLDAWGRKRTVGETQYFDRHLPPIELFRRVVRLTQMIASLCLYKYEKENEGQEVPHTVFTQYINEDENQMEGELAFDASFFKANRKMRVSAEVKSTLLMPPEQRTEQQLAKVLFALRSIRAFAEYPQRIQQKLVKVGWLETHQSKRAILRQGHIPQAFYFVLSGSAVVTVMEEHEHFARTVHFLRRGESFGELAIVHDTRRQATVISREAIELLVVSREDFVDIFMLAGGIKNINDPDHQKFIRNIELLKGWPLHLMAGNPKKCMFHFFRSGSVLVRDSNHSDWIYIVKSGSCQVLKKLRDVKSRLIEHKDRVVGFENVRSLVPRAVSRSKLDRVRAKLSVVMLLLKSPTLHSDSDDNDNLTENRDDGNAIDKVAAAQNVLTTLRSSSDLINRIRTKQQSETVRSFSSGNRRRVGVVNGDHRVKFTNSQTTRLMSTSDDSLPLIERKSRERARTTGAADYRELRQRRLTPEAVGSSARTLRNFLPNIGEALSGKAPCLSPVLSQGNTNSLRPSNDSGFNTPRGRSSTVPKPGKYGRTRTKSMNRGDEDEEEAKMPSHKISVIDEGELKETEVKITEADLHPAFVQVALLSKGDSFGVASMLFEDQPSLSLVSNGAECIMISKKFYLAHCTDAMKRRLMTTERPYPDEETLQRSLQDKVNWEAYKRKTMKSLVRALPTARRREISLQDHLKSKRDMILSQDLKDALKRMRKGPDES